MVRQIDEQYRNFVQDGKEVVEILISAIGYDHLKSELNNIKEMPEWIGKLNLRNDVRGFKIVSNNVG